MVTLALLSNISITAKSFLYSHNRQQGAVEDNLRLIYAPFSYINASIRSICHYHDCFYASF